MEQETEHAEQKHKQTTASVEPPPFVQTLGGNSSFRIFSRGLLNEPVDFTLGSSLDDGFTFDLNDEKREFDYVYGVLPMPGPKLDADLLEADAGDLREGVHAMAGEDQAMK